MPGKSTPPHTGTRRQSGSAKESLPVNVVPVVVVRVDQVPSDRCRCTLTCVALALFVQVMVTVPPPEGLVSVLLVTVAEHDEGGGIW